MASASAGGYSVSPTFSGKPYDGQTFQTLSFSASVDYTSYTNSDNSVTYTITGARASWNCYITNQAVYNAQRYCVGCCGAWSHSWSSAMGGGSITTLNFGSKGFPITSGSANRSPYYTFTLQPGESRSVPVWSMSSPGCGSPSGSAYFYNSNSRPSPTPPSLSTNCSASTANGNTLTMRASISYGYCGSQSNSSSYAVYDNEAMATPIKSGSGGGGVITGLAPNTRYWAMFTASNGCYNRSATCNAVTVTPNTLSEATPISYDKAKVRLAVTNGGGEYDPTTKIYAQPCAGGTATEVATSTTKSVAYVEFDGLEPETCYNIYAVTTTPAGSYTGNTVTITTPRKGICLAEFTKVEPAMDDETLEAYADICYKWETTKVPATIVVRYQVKNGYDTTWYESEVLTTEEYTGTYCLTLHDLYPNQTVYQAYIHTETDEATYDSPMMEFMTPLVPEPENFNCANFFYLTELLCQSVKRLLNGNKTIYANPYSQALCDPYTDDPTMLTIWSRALRLFHAMFCVMGNLGGILTASKEGQYLVGEIGWTDILKEIDETNTDDNWKLATSGAIYKYLQDKLDDVWHYGGTVDALVYELSDLDSMTTATSAIVTSENSIYRKTDGEWVKSTADADKLVDHAVWHINLASNTEAGVVLAGSAWYYWEGNWQPMDADIAAYTKIIDAIFDKKDQIVITPESEDIMEMIVRDKDAFDCAEIGAGRKVVFITEPMATPSPEYHLITFNTEDGTAIQPQQVLNGKLPQKPDNPTRTGYSFVRWEENGAEYDWSMPILADHTLDAVWQAQTFTVCYDLNGGTGELPPCVDVYYGETLDSLPDGAGITKPGGTFIGWTRDGEDFSVTDPILGDTILAAKWQMEALTVTFDPQDGTTPIVVNTTYGSFIDAPTVTREDYILTGWTTEPTGGTVFDPDVPVTANATYYAQWVDEFYTVTFDTDGGSTIEPVRVQYNTAVTKPADPTKDKAKFNNWTLNGVVYDFDTPVTANITLLANWISVWDVTFDLNGGEGDAPTQQVDDGEYATKPSPDPTNGDCPFEGWKEEDTGGG